MFRPTKIYIEQISPHIRRKRTARMCMIHVMIALIPTTACALYFFGTSALWVLLTSIFTCVVAECAIVKFMLGKEYRMTPTAAALTGLLLGLNLPASAPLWTVMAGSVVAIGIGKMAFGGLGCNIFNPALVGRVFMLISFPVVMTTWPAPLGGIETDVATGASIMADGTTGATMLTLLKHGYVPEGAYVFSDLVIGNMRGSMGEVASAALLLGLAYLLIFRVISWHIPVAIIAAVVGLDLLLGVQAELDVLSGGLLLGSIFMATDYVTSPMTHKGMLVYGVMIGVITVVIRRWGAYPEGMSFAILIMNGFTPIINRYFKPRRFGMRRKEVMA